MSAAADTSIALELDGFRPASLGSLQAAHARGRTTLSITFDNGWLAHHPGVVLDPAIAPFPGPQYPPRAAPLFGLLADISPDRWGRLLMRRRVAREARLAGIRARTLTDLDYLLGVHDLQRSGALRLRGVDGRCHSSDHQLAAPPWASLRALEQAAWALDRPGDIDDEPGYDEWLRLLVAPGSSLGGARPKAGVVDEAGALWIAKFPSTSDERDMGAWEFVVWRLARAAGIVVPEARLEKFAGRHHTFLVKRFDRDGARRIHYASAMTLTSKSDGEPASYLDIVQAISRFGAAPAVDLPQLWRRIVFSICISNLDDHLRNHGFLMEAATAGWRLAPAFDQNPTAGDGPHALSIDGADDANDLELARGVARWFRVNVREATRIITEVSAVVGRWSREASVIGLSRGEREAMAGAFENASPSP